MALRSKTTICFLELGLLIFAAVPLSVASQINATVGQSVLLPCFISPPPPPLKDTRVYWQTVQDSDGHASVLHFINKGKEELQHQAPQYRNRTAMDLSQVAAGNLSLELRNVTAADNQTTICCLWAKLMQQSDPTQGSRITLTVLQIPDVAPDPPSFSGWAIGLIVTVLLLLLAVILYIVHRRWTRTRDDADSGANRGEDAEELDQVTTNGTANGTSNGTTNVTANDTAIDTANGTMNSTANDTANGTANDKEPQSDTPLMNGHS